MTTPYEIPLSPEPQKLSIVLGGVAYRLTVKWNRFNQSWILDIADENDLDILTGLPLITGSDLLAQYSYLGFKGKLIVQSDGEVDKVPSFTTLGGPGRLYFVTEP